MVCEGEECAEDTEVRSRSFRYEDYSNRRVFLRSYPLYWEDGDEDKVVRNSLGCEKKEKRSVRRRRILTVLERGGKVFFLRNLKSKVAHYLVACRPFGYKASNPLLSV